jgi:hypothetical protein
MSASVAGSQTGVSSGRAGAKEFDRVYGTVRERWFARHEAQRGGGQRQPRVYERCDCVALEK